MQRMELRDVAYVGLRSRAAGCCSVAIRERLYMGHREIVVAQILLEWSSSRVAQLRQQQGRES